MEVGNDTTSVSYYKHLNYRALGHEKWGSGRGKVTSVQLRKDTDLSLPL